jgi:hypothetical protein
MVLVVNGWDDFKRITAGIYNVIRIMDQFYFHLMLNFKSNGPALSLNLFFDRMISAPV